MRKSITLSDGTAMDITLHPRLYTEYYPDIPHCTACDRRATEARLSLCTAPLLGSRYGACRRYICAACSGGTGVCLQHHRHPEGAS